MSHQAETTQNKDMSTLENNATKLAVKLTPKENRVISFYKDATPFDWEDWRWQPKFKYANV